MRPPPLRAPASRRGVAAVELAFLLPFLALAFVGAIDFGRVFYFSLTVSNCARNGAVYAGAGTTQALDTSGIRSACLKDAGNLDSQQLGVTSATDSSTNPTYVDVTVSYPFATVTGYAGFGALTLTRTVRIRVVPAVPRFS